MFIFLPLILTTFYSQALCEKKEGREENKVAKYSGRKKDRKREIERKENLKTRKSESEIEACGGLWAGAAAASA